MRDIKEIKKDVDRMNSDTFELDATIGNRNRTMGKKTTRTAKQEAVYQDRLAKLAEFNELAVTVENSSPMDYEENNTND